MIIGPDNNIGRNPNILREERLDPQAREILVAFSQRSGFPVPEIQRRLGSIVMGQLMLPYEQILGIYFKDSPESEAAQEFQEDVQEYKRRKMERARFYFWDKLLTYQVAQGADIGEGTEPIFEVLALNGLATLDSELAQYHRANWSFYNDILEDDRWQVHPLILNYDETEVRRRAAVVQEGLDAIQRIGLEIINRGNIPLARLLFLNPERKQRFLEEYQGASEFEPKDSDLSLEGYAIEAIGRHVDIKLTASPFDSWSYAAPSGRNIYAYSRLGLNASIIILVTEKSRGEFLWGREVPPPALSRSHYPDQWRFYKEHSLHAPAISNDYPIAKLQEEGFSGVIIPEGEREATLWGKHPIKGIVEINPDVE